ncbi:MAG: lipoyl synthase [Nanoarchaeota archaeon]
METTLTKPEWLTIKLTKTQTFNEIKNIIKKDGLATVCEESNCPNILECWNGGTATFMVLGNVCTRGCKFCNVKTGTNGGIIDSNEPAKLLDAVKKLKLDYIVITSVDRDDLPDQGAEHIAKCITKLRSIHVEALIPDFRGEIECIKTIVNAKPDVISHNIETVERLQKTVRDLRANYEQSLKVLESIKKIDRHIYTKSSIMVGLGETYEEVIQTMKNLRDVNVDFITIGQYLRPSKKHLTVKEYVPLEVFNEYQKQAIKLGFKYAASGPFVRSSYKAGELFVKNVIENGAA